MAPMIFTDAIINKKILKIFNYGNMSRSFTFIDDVINILMKFDSKACDYQINSLIQKNQIHPLVGVPIEF